VIVISGVVGSGKSFRGGAVALAALVVALATMWSAGAAFADQTREYKETIEIPEEEKKMRPKEQNKETAEKTTRVKTKEEKNQK